MNIQLSSMLCIGEYGDSVAVILDGQVVGVVAFGGDLSSYDTVSIEIDGKSAYGSDRDMSEAEMLDMASDLIASLKGAQ
jgi:hypothetical protein